MKKLVMFLLFFSVNVTGQEVEARLFCSITGMTHGKNFIISNDLKLTVSTSGWGTTIFLQDSPITTTKGSLTVREILSFEGEESQESYTSKEVIRISEESEQYVLLIDKFIYRDEIEGTYYTGKLLKGADVLNEGDLHIVFDSIVCYGSETALDF
ncbi:MAG: hypothetical protein JNM93_11365 [Bacteriovoracaceae bacterium]|nr:hypothetical protein [Bacteriovoracaceae bacterium]